MAKIKIKKGLTIPMKGEPRGTVESLAKPRTIALDVGLFEEVGFKILVNVGDTVKIGEPLLHDKKHPMRLFVSPAGGTLKEIRRGLKRRLLSLVIEVADTEEYHIHEPLTQITPEALCSRGLFAHIRMRPFNLLANPKQLPKCIFVKALESAPFLPPPELQIESQKEHFQSGLDALAALAPVHLVCRKDSPFHSFQNIESHTATGPHPIANPSVHIAAIAPIRSIEDIVWTVTAHDVLCIGHMVRTGKAYTERVIGLGGTGIKKEKRQFLRVRQGTSLSHILQGRTTGDPLRLISGNPLTGHKSEPEDFLGFAHFAVSVIPENKRRQFLHFLRPGFGKYSATRSYSPYPQKNYPFTTNMHGEERAFIDGHIYDRVMPLKIPTMPLVKAILSEDWDQAELLGILEIAAEDFALPTFICPSKIEMSQIVKEGLAAYADEMLH